VASSGIDAAMRERIRLCVPLAHRYERQIEKAIRDTIAAWDRSITWLRNEVQDMRGYAWECLYRYERTGELDKWNAKVGGNQSRLEHYVYWALKRDLSNWVRSLSRRLDREGTVAPEIADWLAEVKSSGNIDDVTMALSFPLLSLKAIYRLRDKDIAKALGISVRTVERRIEREKAQARAA
jgi:hypothetical protein